MSAPTAPTAWQRRSVARRLKRAIDIVGAAAGLAVAAPVMAICAAAVRIQLGSPILFKQQRSGLHGEPFWLLKFRTMRPAPAGTADTAALSSDAARLTPLGNFLRSSSLDELPSLWNVVRGELSLVGARPFIATYWERYSPAQRRRLDMPPGVTGWAQINGRNTRTWEEKFALDIEYVDRWSLWLDAKILALTVAHLVRREGINAPEAATMPEFLGTPAPTVPPR